MKILKNLIILTAINTVLSSCTSDPGSLEAMNSASMDRRNIIGIELTNITGPQRARGKYAGEGVYVSAVIPQHPASFAGVQAGDIIVSINSLTVSSVSEALTVINELEGGRKYPFQIYRMLAKPESRHLIAYVLIEEVQERAISRIS